MRSSSPTATLWPHPLSFTFAQPCSGIQRRLTGQLLPWLSLCPLSASSSLPCLKENKEGLLLPDPRAKSGVPEAGLPSGGAWMETENTVGAAPTGLKIVPWKRTRRCSQWPSKAFRWQWAKRES